jgi:transposase-like protein
MYTVEVRQRTLALLEGGSSLRSVSMATGINRSTLRDWRDHPEKATAVSPRECRSTDLCG